MASRAVRVVAILRIILLGPCAAAEPTSAPSSLPTQAANCNTTIPCPSGEYCEFGYFPSGEEGYCRPCIPSGTSPEITSSCTGNFTEECIRTCFPNFFCSNDTPCIQEGQWCDYRVGSSGICTTCTFISYPGRCNEISVAAAQRDCKSTCLDSCFTDADCQDGSFCAVENNLVVEEGRTSDLGILGYCTDCTILNFTENPINCQKNTPYFSWSKENEEACLAKCFQACVPSQAGSPSTKTNCGGANSTTGFCNLIGGSDAEFGYCKACDQLSLQQGNPLDCFLLVDDAISAKDCASTCFGACTLDDDDDNNNCATKNGTFCAFGFPDTDQGYCSNCSGIKNVNDCFQQNASDAAKKHCASTCFGECSKTSPCHEGSFCNFQNDQDGYCSPCSNLVEPLECVTLSPDAQESCVTSCYEVCSDYKSCPSYVDFDHVFCDYQVNNSWGACSDCPFPDPKTCQVWNNTTSLTKAGQEACTTTCFRPCRADSVIADCGLGHTCTLNGYCLPFYPLPSRDDQTTDTPTPAIDANTTRLASRGTNLGALVGVIITISSCFL